MHKIVIGLQYHASIHNFGLNCSLALLVFQLLFLGIGRRVLHVLHLLELLKGHLLAIWRRLPVAGDNWLADLMWGLSGLPRTIEAVCLNAHGPCSGACIVLQRHIWILLASQAPFLILLHYLVVKILFRQLVQI